MITFYTLSPESACGARILLLVVVEIALYAVSTTTSKSYCAAQVCQSSHERAKRVSIRHILRLLKRVSAEFLHQWIERSSTASYLKRTMPGSSITYSFCQPSNLYANAL